MAETCANDWPFNLFPEQDWTPVCKVYGSGQAVTFKQALVAAGLKASPKPTASTVQAVHGLLYKYANWYGLTDGDICVLTAWLGGARDYDSLSYAEQAASEAGYGVQTAQVACGYSAFWQKAAAPDINSILAKIIKQGDNDAAELLLSAGNAAEAKTKADEKRNIDEDSKKIYQQAGFALGGAGLLVVGVLVLLALAKK